MKTVQLARRFVREDWGGTETVVLETSKRLLKTGHPTKVFSTLANTDVREDAFDGLEVRRFPHFYPYIGLSEESKEILERKGGSPFSFPLMRALKNEPDLDLIHLHGGNRIGGIGRYVAEKRGIPYVISLHGGVFDVPAAEAASLSAPTQGTLDWGKALGWWVGSRQVLHDAGAVLCVGYPESVLTQERLPGKRVEYLPNGADTARFETGDGPAFRAKHGIPQDARVMLTVARIDSQKNQHLPARLLSELRDIDATTHLLIIGNVTNTAYHQALEKLVADQGLRAHATIVPGIPTGSSELVDAYHAADVFLLPSIHEPFGIVILEAWAAGLPVLASRVGGVPHFVEDGTDGLLFDPDDDATLLTAFRSLVEGEGLADKLAKAGWRKAREEYDWDAVTQKLVKIYEEVLVEHSVRQ